MSGEIRHIEIHFHISEDHGPGWSYDEIAQQIYSVALRAVGNFIALNPNLGVSLP